MITYKKAILLVFFVGVLASFSGGVLASARFDWANQANISDILKFQYWKNLFFPEGGFWTPKTSLSPPAGGSPPVIDQSPGVSPLSQPVLDYEAAKIAAVKRASPAVVSIIITKDLPVLEQYYINPFRGFGYGDEFFDQFFGIPQYRQKGTEKREVGGGTGFIITGDGLILTNKHVVQDEKAEYTVLTNDEKRYPAKVLARDPVLDLAIIKVDKTGLPTVTLGDSGKLELGQTVITIGNALGEFRNTVSIGAVSGLARQITASGGGQLETLKGIIQTDAAINQGNSGGPLLDLRGEVVGINTAMAVGAQSIGFAIPINQAKSAIESVKKEGRIVIPFLGVRYAIINNSLKEKNNLLFNYGALVRRGESADELAVIPGSPADKAGIAENDIILEINGEKITEDNDLASIIRTKKVGEEITLNIWSKGVEKIIRAKLEERK
ncbi:MAG: trypsin-like peptidase domain-containing protein [bacterium]|nr:trypsin-like peptidase domain-containing protein [bacterium]